MEAKDFNWEEGTVVVLGKGNRYRKAPGGNCAVGGRFTEHDSLGITAGGVSTVLKRLGRATVRHTKIVTASERASVFTRSSEDCPTE